MRRASWASFSGLGENVLMSECCSRFERTHVQDLGWIGHRAQEGRARESYTGSSGGKSTVLPECMDSFAIRTVAAFRKPLSASQMVFRSRERTCSRNET